MVYRERLFARYLDPSTDFRATFSIQYSIFFSNFAAYAAALASTPSSNA